MTVKKFTLARLKGIVAALGAILTTATLLDWGYPLPPWVTASASVITAIAVYMTPNIEDEPKPRRALVE